MTITYPELGQRGRLGNCLHQIAGTVGFARSRNERPVFDPDWAYRGFFAMPDEWFSDVWRYASDVTTLVDGNRWERIYLQNRDLWRDCEDEVRAAFGPSPRAVAVLEAIPEPDPADVAVHVRRGDYLEIGPEFFPVPDQHWYAEAQTYLYDYVEGRITAYHAFGDDLEWIDRNLWWCERKRYGQGDGVDWADLHVMARYNHHVISNSSYAWWAAWLSGDDHVVYPSEWFGPKINAPWEQNMEPGWVGL